MKAVVKYEKGENKTYMLYGHVHDTMDQRLIEQFSDITRSTVRTGRDGKEMHIPCNMINCFCMYSDYTPLTLDEWIICDKERREQYGKIVAFPVRSRYSANE